MHTGTRTEKHGTETSAYADMAWFDTLLSPLSSPDFLHDVWGETFVHLPGPKDKFTGLFTWTLLNRILEQYPLQPPRLRLVRAGKEIPVDKYVLTGSLQRGGKTSTLDSINVLNELRLGATLILNLADELSEPLRQLCVNFERIFRKRVGANLYAAFRTDHGFELHWDPQDTLIMQIAGRKEWKIYEPTCAHPVREGGGVPTTPTKPPVWEGILDEGCLFHIPRGWWHVARPVDEPSLHLTITVRSYTGIDLVSWIANQLTTSLIARTNLPVWHSADQRREYGKQLREEFIRRWTPTIIDQFLDEMDACAEPRPRFRLPDTAKEGPCIHENAHVRLSTSRRAVVYSGTEEGKVTLKVNGKAWHCSNRVLPVLDLLSDGKNHSMRELCALLPGGAPESTAHEFIIRLAEYGLIVSEPDGG